MIPRLPSDLLEIVEGESIVWAGKPFLKPFIAKRLPGMVAPLLFMLIPLSLPISIYEIMASAGLFAVLFFIFWYGVLSLALVSATLYPLFVWRNLYYVLTDKRIVVRKGVIGIDYDFLKLELVQQVNVNIGIWDKIYGSGTVVIQAVGVSPLVLENVGEPLEVRRLIENLVSRIKLKS